MTADDRYGLLAEIQWLSEDLDVGHRHLDPSEVVAEARRVIDAQARRIDSMTLNAADAAAGPLVGCMVARERVAILVVATDGEGGLIKGPGEGRPPIVFMLAASTDSIASMVDDDHEWHIVALIAVPEGEASPLGRVLDALADVGTLDELRLAVAQAMAA